MTSEMLIKIRNLLEESHKILKESRITNTLRCSVSSNIP